MFFFWQCDFNEQMGCCWKLGAPFCTRRKQAAVRMLTACCVARAVFGLVVRSLQLSETLEHQSHSASCRVPSNCLLCHTRSVLLLTTYAAAAAAAAAVAASALGSTRKALHSANCCLTAFYATHEPTSSCGYSKAETATHARLQTALPTAPTSCSYCRTKSTRSIRSAQQQ